MNRRNYISTLTAGIVPLLNDEWREQLWNETDPPSATETPALQDFLIPESALSDEYTPIAPGPMTLNPVSESSKQSLCQGTVTTRNEDGNQIQYYIAEKGYAVPTTGEMVAEKEAKLTTKALKPTDLPEIETTPNDLHQYLYNDWWGSGNGGVEDYATELVEVQSNERTTPNQWTEYFVRQPVLYLDPELTGSSPSEQSYFEFTLIIATTDWGVISIEGQSLQFGEESTSFESVQNLVEELHQQARDAPAPTFDRESGMSQ